MMEEKVTNEAYFNESNEGTENKSMKLVEKLANERKQWLERVKDMANRIKDIDNLAALQVDVYSARQELLEHYHYLSSLVGFKNIELRKKKKKLLEYYTTGYDYKLDKEQREMYIKIDLEAIYLVRDELENHMKFISNTINTVDNIIYGIKHRITLEEYKKRL